MDTTEKKAQPSGAEKGDFRKGFFFGIPVGVLLTLVLVTSALYFFRPDLFSSSQQNGSVEAVEVTAQSPVLTESQIREWISQLDIQLADYRARLEPIKRQLDEARRYYSILRNVKGVPKDDPRCVSHINTAKVCSDAINKLTAEIGKQFKCKQELQYKLEALKLKGIIEHTPGDSQLIANINSSIGAEDFMNSPSFLEYDSEEEVVDPDQFMMGESSE